MKPYTLMLNPQQTTAIRWQYVIHVASDKMAIDFASRALKNDPAAVSAARIQIFDTDADRFVAQVEAEYEPRVTVRHLT